MAFFDEIWLQDDSLAGVNQFPEGIPFLGTEAGCIQSGKAEALADALIGMVLLAGTFSEQTLRMLSTRMERSHFWIVRKSASECNHLMR